MSRVSHFWRLGGFVLSINRLDKHLISNASQWRRSDENAGRYLQVSRSDPWWKAINIVEHEREECRYMGTNSNSCSIWKWINFSIHLILTARWALSLRRLLSSFANHNTHIMMSRNSRHILCLLRRRLSQSFAQTQHMKKNCQINFMWNTFLFVTYMIPSKERGRDEKSENLFRRIFSRKVDFVYDKKGFFFIPDISLFSPSSSATTLGGCSELCCWAGEIVWNTAANETWAKFMLLCHFIYV